MTPEESIFNKHYEYYKNVGVETIKQQAGQVEQVGSDYQGRVIYELLQNAFDKADKNILVKVRGNSLYVANDGTRFTYVENFDYRSGSSERGDFQSLCSISTSNKNVNTSIGNKGVGFKSVFSVAEEGFVNIFTQGSIINGGNKRDETISFRVYDSFKDANNIPNGFDSVTIENLIGKIQQVQLEREDRGVPGYYFPLHIPNEDEYILDLFNYGFVTVIQIPFKDRTAIKELFEEIKKIHFQFIQLKYENQFEIKFELDEERTDQHISNDPNILFVADVTSERIKLIAQEAGITIDRTKVAFFIKDKPGGLLYNYLPTKVVSPFRYIDFHADFHTTVDRKSINFDGKIGEYNRALQRACLELFLCTINNYLDEVDRVELDLKFIDKQKVNCHLSEFDWNWLEVGNASIVFYAVRSILGIWNNNQYDYSYEIASKLFGRLARQYFKQERIRKHHDAFFKVIIVLINDFGRDDKQRYDWLEYFKKDLANVLKDNGARVIPDASLSDQMELVYRKSYDSSIKIPVFLGVNITDFEIKDDYFRKALGIKDFNDYNEILKYYKQASYSGHYDPDHKLSEVQQKELLKSLAEIFVNKKESITASSHRYSRTYTAKDRDYSSTINQANFNISTVFLKTQNGKYKPAQLCRKIDLDTSFLSELAIGEQLDYFLKFIGVSLDSNYIFADIRIYNRLNAGLDYIPFPISQNESTEKLTGESILNNVRVINSKGKGFHPALINENNYYFLENISGKNIKPELDVLLIKQYEKFPKEYIDVLFKKVKEPSIGIERLYPSLFYPFHNYLGKYLTVTRNKLKWLLLEDVFFIAKNREDYEILKSQDITILCYFNGIEIPDVLSGKIISLVEGEIVAEAKEDITKKITDNLYNKMVFILAGITNSSQSDLNFKEDLAKVKTIQETMQGLKIFETTKLTRKITCVGAELRFENEFSALFDRSSKTIYFTKNGSTKVKTEILAKYIFNNISIVSELELILFFKDVCELAEDYPKEDVNFFKQVWIKDYDKKYSQFLTEVLAEIIIQPRPIEPSWNIYNAFHKSDLLLKIFNMGKFYELEARIELVKAKFEGLFDDFYLEVDFGLNDERIGKIIMFMNTYEVAEREAYTIELESISKKLGQENRLQEIEKELINKYQFNTEKPIDSTKTNEIEKSLAFDRKVNSIFDKISAFKDLPLVSFSARGKAIETNIQTHKKKLVFQGSDASTQEEEYLAGIGAKGEEQVLGYFINQFLLLPVDRRKKGILEINSVIKEELGNDSHNKYKDECLKVLDDTDKLRKALIPFFYISMHYKYSYFDLVAYKNDKPIIVEVKTTQSDKDDGFYISISEVNKARKEENYEIVRVTPSEIIFMGNPIKVLDDKITSLKGDNYQLIPRNYKFEFSK